jgi:hypothetical protein
MRDKKFCIDKNFGVLPVTRRQLKDQGLFRGWMTLFVRKPLNRLRGYGRAGGVLNAAVRRSNQSCEQLTKKFPSPSRKSSLSD